MRLRRLRNECNVVKSARTCCHFSFDGVVGGGNDQLQSSFASSSRVDTECYRNAHRSGRNLVQAADGDAWNVEHVAAKRRTRNVLLATWNAETWKVSRLEPSKCLKSILTWSNAVRRPSAWTWPAKPHPEGSTCKASCLQLGSWCKFAARSCRILPARRCCRHWPALGGELHRLPSLSWLTSVLVRLRNWKATQALDGR